MSKRFSTRSFVSICLFLFFLVMLVTSVLMFANRHTALVAMMHTVLGALLLLLLVWHLKNNMASLVQHSKIRGRTGPNLAMPTALIVGIGLLMLSLFEFRPFLAFYEWGNQLRAGDTSNQQGKFIYDRVNQMPANANGLALSVDVRTGPFFAWPQYAIWLETLEGEFLQVIYVTRKLAENNFSTKAMKKDSNLVFTSDLATSGELDSERVFEFKDDPETSGQRERPESLPVFLHKLKDYRQHPVAPKGEDVFDGYAGATLTNNFLLSSKTRKPIKGPFKVRMEINQSFDFNEYYSSNRFPEDPIYSGDGYSAQPSVVYEAVIDPESNQTYYPMTLVGHGHHSGRDGVLYKDLKNLTTALQILDRVIVEVGNPALERQKSPQADAQ